jgi:hypothetical protein
VSTKTSGFPVNLRANHSYAGFDLMPKSKWEKMPIRVAFQHFPQHKTWICFKRAIFRQYTMKNLARDIETSGKAEP